MSDVSPSIRMPLGRRLPAIGVRSVDRLDVALGAVFLLSACFYIWIAGISVPFSLHDPTGDRYNLLANAFLHLRLSVGPAPAAIVHLANPYSPRQLATVPGGVNDITSFNDDAMYGGQLYFIWGPAPALVLLVPMHVLGFEPSQSFTDAFYGVVGMGFALLALRVLIRHLGRTRRMPVWMCALAGFAISLSSVVPFLMRTPTITIETIAGGYCFAMAGLWLAIAAIVERRASLKRLALMSLCFGLAANSRPTLWLTALLAIPVYLALRGERSRRSLLLALGLPVSICFLLFLAYNQARFHSPLEVGSHYQLTGYESRTAPLGRLSYVLPGLGFYAFTLPQFQILFPFLHLMQPRLYGAVGLAPPEPTGGILPMAPIVLLALALPWLWLRRRSWLGRLGPLLLALLAVGVAIPVLPAYDFLASTERYEVDFATLLVFAGLAVWLALASSLRGYRRRLLQFLGGALIVWGCAAGVAISFYGSGPELYVTHPATWRKLEDLGAPISTALAAAAGHPVVAVIAASHVRDARVSRFSIASPVSEFSVNTHEQVDITIVSPSSRKATLEMNVLPQNNVRYQLIVNGPGNATSTFALSGYETVKIPLALRSGLNYLTLHPVSRSALSTSAGVPTILFTHPSVN